MRRLLATHISMATGTGIRSSDRRGVTLLHLLQCAWVGAPVLHGPRLGPGEMHVTQEGLPLVSTHKLCWLTGLVTSARKSTKHVVSSAQEVTVLVDGW